MLKLYFKMTYNLTLVLKSSLKEDQRKKLVETIKESFGKAEITEKEWGQKPLSYPIQKELSGYFLNMKAETDNVIPSDFEKKLFSNENILRHLFLRTN